MLSMSTDYAEDTGSPELQLRRIAEAGFTHVHWCHHWDDDFLYGPPKSTRLHAGSTNLGCSSTACTRRKGSRNAGIRRSNTNGLPVSNWFRTASR